MFVEVQNLLSQKGDHLRSNATHRLWRDCKRQPVSRTNNLFLMDSKSRGPFAILSQHWGASPSLLGPGLVLGRTPILGNTPNSPCLAMPTHKGRCHSTGPRACEGSETAPKGANPWPPASYLRIWPEAEALAQESPLLGNRAVKATPCGTCPQTTKWPPWSATA